MPKAVTYEEVWVDAKKAQEYLDQNLLNRKVSPVTVTAYSRDMTQKNWHYNGAPIAFDTEGNLLDGQHRLLAVIRSNTKQKFLVVCNLQPDSRRTIDIGRKRSVADNLVMDFQIKNSSQVASSARMIIKWREGFLRASNNYKITDAEITDFVVENDGTLQDAAAFAQKLRRVLPVSLASVTAAFHETTRVDSGKAGIFWTQVVTGAGLEIGDPALSFRNAVVRIGSKHEDRSLLNLELAVRAWRYHVSDRKTGQNFVRKNLSQIREHDFAIEKDDFDGDES